MLSDTERRILDVLMKHKAKSVCVCGHVGDGEHTAHFDTFQFGHGACKVEGCDCQQFTWARWTEEMQRAIEKVKTL